MCSEKETQKTLKAVGSHPWTDKELRNLDIIIFSVSICVVGIIVGIIWLICELVT